MDIATIIQDLYLNTPNGMDEQFNIGNINCHLTKDQNQVKISMKTSDNNDVYMGYIIHDFEESLSLLSDDLFLEILEELKSSLNFTEFNSLLKLKTCSKEQALKLKEMINIAKTIIRNKLSKEIELLLQAYNRF